MQNGFASFATKRRKKQSFYFCLLFKQPVLYTFIK